VGNISIRNLFTLYPLIYEHMDKKCTLQQKVTNEKPIVFSLKFKKRKGKRGHCKRH
jgi:hypothetical protein